MILGFVFNLQGIKNVYACANVLAGMYMCVFVALFVKMLYETI